MTLARTLYCALFLVLFTLVGCGGGTTGSDGGGGARTLTLSGEVLATSGSPLKGYEVTILESGDSALSGENGEFVIEGMIETLNPTLLIQGEGVDTTVSMGEILEQDSVATVILSVDLEIGSVAVADFTVSILDEMEGEQFSTEMDIPEMEISDPDIPSSEADHELEPTPIPRSTFKGVVIGESGEPLPGVTVTLLETKESDITNNRGRFSIRTRLRKKIVNLRFVLGDPENLIDGTVTISDLPKRQIEVELQLLAIGEKPIPPDVNPALLDIEMPRVEIVEISISRK